MLYRKRGQTQVLRLEKGEGEDHETVELTVSGRVNVDDYTAMVELVAAGQGIGLMPELHVAEGERAGRLVRIFPEWVLPAPPGPPGVLDQAAPRARAPADRLPL